MCLGSVSVEEPPVDPLGVIRLMHRRLTAFGMRAVGVGSIPWGLVGHVSLHHLKDPKLWELWYLPYYG